MTRTPIYDSIQPPLPANVIWLLFDREIQRRFDAAVRRVRAL